MDGYSVPKKPKKIGDLFFKYQSVLKPPQATIEKACVEAIFNITGLKISSDMVTYNVSTKNINLKTPSLIKTEIKLRQIEILNELERILGQNKSPKNLI